MGRRAIKTYGFSAFGTVFYVNILKVQSVSVAFLNVIFSLPLEMSNSWGFSKRKLSIFNIQKVSKFDGFPNKKFCPQAVILFETKACACQNLHIFHNTVVSITSGMKCVLSLAFKKFWFDKVAKKVQNLVKEEK